MAATAGESPEAQGVDALHPPHVSGGSDTDSFVAVDTTLDDDVEEIPRPELRRTSTVRFAPSGASTPASSDSDSDVDLGELAGRVRELQGLLHQLAVLSGDQPTGNQPKVQDRNDSNQRTSTSATPPTASASNVGASSSKRSASVSYSGASRPSGNAQGPSGVGDMSLGDLLNVLQTLPDMQGEHAAAAFERFQERMAGASSAAGGHDSSADESSDSRNSKKAQGNLDNKKSEKKRKTDKYDFDYNYEQRYATSQQSVSGANDLPDNFGDEASANALVWRRYGARSQETDQPLLDSWHNTLNVLLAFAALFSAVVTAFLTEAFKALKPDRPPSSQAPRFVPSIQARMVNGFLFTSLALSLCVSLLAILAKQWLDEFTSRMRAPAASARQRALRHHVLREGLDEWKLDSIISVLPFLLHTATFMFLFALVTLLYDVDMVVATVVFVLLLAALSSYLAFTLIPLRYGAAPFVTSLLNPIHRIWFYCSTLAARLKGLHTPIYDNTLAPFHEKQLVDAQEDDLIARVLQNMIGRLANPEDVNIALGAIGSLDTLNPTFRRALGTDLMRTKVMQRFLTLSISGSSVEAAEAASILRTMLFLDLPTAAASSAFMPHIASALRKWSKIKTHDVSVLCERFTREAQAQSGFSADTLKGLYRWLRGKGKNSSLPTPIHPTSLGLMIARGSDWDLSELLLLVPFTNGAPAMPSVRSTPGHTALTAVIDRIAELLAGSISKLEDAADITEEGAEIITQWVAFQAADRSNISVRLAQLWVLMIAIRDELGLLSDAQDIRLLGVDEQRMFGPLVDLLTFRVVALSQEGGHAIMTLQQLEEVLAPVGREGFLTQPWSIPAVGCLVQLLLSAFATDRRVYWSAGLGNIVRHIIARIPRMMAQSGKEKQRTVVSISSSAVRKLQEMPGWLLYAISPCRNCRNVPTYFRSHSSADDAIWSGHLNTLLPLFVRDDGSTISTWSLAFEIDSRMSSLSHYALLASDLTNELCCLHRQKQDVAQLFGELLGGTRGADLIRCAGHWRTRWEIAIHGREIARAVDPKWWKRSVQHIRAKSSEWKPDRKCPDANSFLAQFEADEDDVLVCVECPDTASFEFTGGAQDPPDETETSEKAHRGASQANGGRTAGFNPLNESRVFWQESLEEGFGGLPMHN